MTLSVDALAHAVRNTADKVTGKGGSSVNSHEVKTGSDSHGSKEGHGEDKDHASSGGAAAVAHGEVVKPLPKPGRPISEVIKTPTTGRELDASGMPTGKEKPTHATKEEELVHEYSRYVGGHIDRLATAFRLHPGFKEKMAKDPRHQLEMMLVDKFTKEGKVNNDDLKKFFETSEGKIAGTVLIEEIMFRLAGSVGRIMKNDPSGEREEQLLDSIPLGGKNILWRLKESFYEEKKSLKQMWRRMVGKMHFEPSEEVFIALQNDPNESDYARLVFLFDIGNMRYDANTKKVVEGNVLGDTNRSARSLQEESSELYHLRQKFFESLGVRPEALDSNSYQSLLTRAKGAASGMRPETTEANFAAEVRIRFNQLRGGTSSPNDIELYSKAQNEVATVFAAGKILEIMHGQSPVEAHTEHVGEGSLEPKEKSAEHASEGNTPEFIPRVKPEQEKLDKLKEEKSKLDELRGRHTTLEASQQKVTEIESKFRDGFAYVKGKTGDLVADIDRTMEELSRELNGFGTTKGIDIRLIALRKSKSVRLGELLKQAEELAGSRPGTKDQRLLDAFEERRARLLKNAQDQADGEFSQIGSLEKRRDEIASQLTELKGIRTEYGRQIQERDKAQLALVTGNPKHLLETQNANSTLGITDTDLDTKSVDELLAPRITGLTEEGIKERRLQIVHALAERKARVYEEGEGIGAHKAFEEIVSKGSISPDDLITLTEYQLLERLYDTAGPYKWDRATDGHNREWLKQARTEAARQFVLRDRMYLDILDKDYGHQIKEQEEVITKVGNVEAFENSRKFAQIVRKRQGEIFQVAYQLFPENTPLIDSLTKKDKLTSANTIFSPEEHKAGLQEGYYKWLDVLTGYQSGAQRGKTFEKMHNAFPPKKLAELINEAIFSGEFNDPIHKTDPSDLDAMLTILQARLKLGYISLNKMQNSMEFIIDRVNKEVNALL